MVIGQEGRELFSLYVIQSFLLVNCLNLLLTLSSGWIICVINCCSTYIQVFYRNGYDMHVHYVVLYTSCAWALCKFQFDRVKGQGSSAWPVFELDSTRDLKYICAKFHHFTFNVSWLIVKRDRTDRQTDGHARRFHKTFLWNT